MQRAAATGAIHIHGGQSFGDPLQEQRIGLQGSVDAAERIREVLLLRGQLIFETVDGVGEILLLDLVLRKIDIKESLGGGGQGQELGVKRIGESGRGVLEEIQE